MQPNQLNSVSPVNAKIFQASIMNGLLIFALRFLLLNSVHFTKGARILALFPWPSKSHMITFSALTHALAENGHDLVVVSSFPEMNPPENITYVSVWKSVENWHKRTLKSDHLFNLPDTSKLLLPTVYWNAGLEVMEMISQDPNLKALLQDERGFDLVICEDFLGEFLFGFAHHFRVMRNLNYWDYY
jgi:glucuronosyltransferase